MKESFLSIPDGTMLEGQARLITKRKMGKVCFYNARFGEESVQLVVSNNLPNYSELVSLPLGSLIYLNGKKIITHCGTPSIKIVSARIVFVFKGKMPDKFHGLSADVRYRNPTLNLLSNSQSFLFVRKITQALHIIRQVLFDRGFNEFITGVLQEKFEAGQAQPFTTNCRATNKELSLSLTSELKLKRLVTAGFERVYEIAQSFRNEGVDKVHSPEFTMIEAYSVDMGLQQMMETVETIVYQVVVACNGEDVVSLKRNDMNLSQKVCYKQPFARVSFRESFEMFVGDWKNCDKLILSKLYPDLFNIQMTKFTWVMKVVEKLLVPNIIEPTFLVDLPTGLSPFVRNDCEDINSERAFLIAQGIFLSDIYSDENDTSKIITALQKQAVETGRQVNDDYLEVLSLGMPETSGFGMGFNRLMMLLLDSLPFNIKETILFPFC